MYCEQVAFFDKENNEYYGIRIFLDGQDNWYIICGCCGAIFSPKDVHGVETLGDWVDFQEYIK